MWSIKNHSGKVQQAAHFVQGIIEDAMEEEPMLVTPKKAKEAVGHLYGGKTRTPTKEDGTVSRAASSKSWQVPMDKIINVVERHTRETNKFVLDQRTAST